MNTAVLIAAIGAALWKGLRKAAQWLGRWVVPEVVRRGAAALATYLEMRVEVFRRRLTRILKRKHAAWRPRWLRGRIRRWLWAARWLREQAKRLAGLAMDRVAPLLRDIPEESPWENAAKWRRMVAR